MSHRSTYDAQRVIAPSKPRHAALPLLIASLLAVPSLASATEDPPTTAASADAATLPEVKITAERRETTLQKTPAIWTAMCATRP